MGRKVFEIENNRKEHGEEPFLLQEAIETALSQGAEVIRLSAGVYHLQEFTTISTTSIAHDDGCGDISSKEVHLLLERLQNLTIEGAVHEDQTPATVLCGYNSGISQTLLPSILWAVGCRNLTLKNLAFTREPECASAGIMEQVREDEIYVRVYEDLPCQDRMAAYCMNRFSPETRTLLGESLTFGFGYDKTFEKVGERLLRLKDSRIASQVNPGEGLSWHQSGKTDFQLFFGDCENLTLENLRIYNTNSFGILTENCKDIKAERLVMKPKGNQFFTGPRDGWKIYRCTGDISLIDCHIEGVRMDGQNVHSNFMTITEVLNEDSLLCVCKYAPTPLKPGTLLEFYRGTRMVTRTIADWEIIKCYQEETVQKGDGTAGAAVVGSSHNMTVYRITLKESITGLAETGMLLTPCCWEPSHYLCKDSRFLNIAGAGHLLRCGDVEITGCSYEHIMNAGILIGAEFDTHCEGGHGVHLKIHHNSFSDCGFKPRYGAYGMGCIAVKSQGFSAPVNRDIEIHDNIFTNSSQGIELCDAAEVTVRRNRYEQIGEPYIIEETSTQRIAIYE